MTWSSNLQSAIVLKDDRRFVTLNDVGKFILSLPEAHQERHGAHRPRLNHMTNDRNRTWRF
jgi:hypothetical protein